MARSRGQGAHRSSGEHGRRSGTALTRFANLPSRFSRGLRWVIEVGVLVVGAGECTAAVTAALREHGSVVLAVFSGILGVLLFLVLAVLVISFEQMATLQRGHVGGVSQNLHDALHELRLARDAIDTHGIDSALWFSPLNTALRMMSEIFSQLTGDKECRLYIKELTYVGPADQVEWASDAVKDHLIVRPLCRTGNPPRDERDKPQKLIAYSDFEGLWDQNLDGARWYFSNDLDKDPEYRSPTRGSPPHCTYNATIVWPIQLDPAMLDPHTSEHVRLFGFLCLDSKLTNIFDNERDGWLGAGFADSIYTACARGSIPGSAVFLPAPSSVSPRPPEGLWVGTTENTNTQTALRKSPTKVGSNGSD